MKDAGFSDVVIATDHGFFLNAQAEAGDLCGKPRRKLDHVARPQPVGRRRRRTRTTSPSPPRRSGIRGDFRVFAGPRSMAPYRRGLLYFHGGASLQEAVVPVLTVRLRKAKAAGRRQGHRRRCLTGTAPGRLPPAAGDRDRRGELATSSRRPAEFEILLEAQDRKGNVVGEPKPGGAVNAATGTITLRPGQHEQITLRMDAGV